MTLQQMILADQPWSYSRLTAFESCPQKFFLKYILNEDQQPQFLSQYGSFMHEIHEKYFKGKIPKTGLLSYYILNYPERVTAKAPNGAIRDNYYDDGQIYWQFFEDFKGDLVSAEERMKFDVGQYHFVGIADMIRKEGNDIVLYDHKARKLKPRSTRKIPTQNDLELDDYFRQLYLYSIPIKEKYGKYPRELILNCYRERTLIHEPFSVKRLKDAEEWATGMVEKILTASEFPPDLDWFSCSNLCGFQDECDYYELL